MIEGRTEIKKPFLSGTTRRIQFQIVDKETGIGFQPDALAMSVYDVVSASSAGTSGSGTTSTIMWCGCHASNHVLTPSGESVLVTVSSSIVNDRNDVDVLAFVDVLGNVDFYLDVDDTGIAVPSAVSATPYQRVVLFTWTWDGSPGKTNKHEIILNILPDRESVAS